MNDGFPYGDQPFGNAAPIPGVTFQDIEDAIITQLQSISYMRTVETYAGQIAQDIEKLPVIFPAAFVAYAGSQLSWVDGPNWNEQATFTVIIGAKNLRSNADQRKSLYGCYQLVRDVLRYLTNQTFNLSIERLQPVRVSLIFISRTVALYGIDFVTNFDTTYDW